MARMMEVHKVFIVEAAHHLTGVPSDHKCARLHGHSFRIEIHVRGEVHAELGWVQDFADIKSAFQPYYDLLDHNYLNEVPGLENPTSENLAHWVWNRVSPSLPLLSKVVICETCTCGCTYTGPLRDRGQET